MKVLLGLEITFSYVKIIGFKLYLIGFLNRKK